MAQSVPPKREFRGVWVATVSNLDWPTTKNNVTSQKNEMTALLDSMSVAGINTIVFQVRPAADAFYSSSYEPWSYWLTGTQGLAPSPLYDPLAYAIAEAHKRGMELHAWFNPYRAVNGTYTLAASHVVNQHPDWILTVGTGQKKILNPGLAEVRSYILNIICDVLRRYNVDGIHMDDYFYPYSPDNITTEDAATFSAYPRGFTNIGNWRRDNVNILVKAIQDSINAVKPYVKFGMSPFGIWKSGVPTGITGMSAYSEIYCDAIKWLQLRAVDYLTPQLYWKIGGSQDYTKLLAWWADSASANERHFYPGQQFTSGYTNSELPNQLLLNRADPAVGGNVLFRAGMLKSNTYNFKDSLKQNYFLYPALTPVMSWKDNVVPLPPQSVAAASGSTAISLSWVEPTQASDGDTAKRFVIYRSSSTTFSTDDPRTIVAITNTDTTAFTDSDVTVGQKYYYAVTSLDKCGNESGLSNTTYATAGVSTTVLANFEGGVGVFNKAPTISGSTYGIDRTSTASYSTASAYSGTGSLLVTLIDSTTSSNDWFVRLLSGSGTPTNNTAFSSEGTVSFWMKTSTAASGAKVAILVDDGSAGTERSPALNVINDGSWHKYSFDLQAYGWSSFYNSDGKLLNPTVSLDAILLTSPNTSTNWVSYIDDVTYSNYGTPLPVELLTFTAKTIKDKVILNWTTASELNNAGFEIEKSVIINGLQAPWRRLGFVAGAGNSSVRISYSFTDFQAERNTRIIYRLKQIDNDGSVSYSEIVEASLMVNSLDLAQNYPNPFNPETKIEYTVPARNGIAGSRVILKVYDILGKEAAAIVDETQAPGSYIVGFDSRKYNLSSGFYIYRLTVDGQSIARKMMLTK